MVRRILIILLLAGLSACAARRGPDDAIYPRDLGYGYAGPCDQPANARQAASLNATSIDTLPVSPFGHMEAGWRTYAPLTAATVGTTCPPMSPGFAEALARWKVAHRLAYDGAMDDRTLQTLKGAWQERRPFMMGRVRKEPCPTPPDQASMVFIAPSESHYGKPILLRPGTLNAYRRMAAAARADLGPTMGSPDPMAFTIFSGFRSPEYDAAQCAQQGGCNGVARAGACSAHRTGLAFDLVIAAAPGARVDTASDANRRFQSETPLYQWLVRNAGKFGFVNYPYEPWHWEWTGEAP